MLRDRIAWASSYILAQKLDPNRGNMPSHKKKRIPGKSSLPADYAHPMGMGPMGYPHPGFWMQPGFFGFQGLLHTWQKFKSWFKESTSSVLICWNGIWEQCTCLTFEPWWLLRANAVESESEEEEESEKNLWQPQRWLHNKLSQHFNWWFWLNTM